MRTQDQAGELSTSGWLFGDITSCGGEAGGDADEGRLAVTHPLSVLQRVEEAGNLAEVLDVAYEAFETMLSVIDGYHDSRSPFYAGLVMAAAAAADGRDALVTAPSLPLPSRDDVHAAGSAGGAGSGCGPVTAAAVDPKDAAGLVAALSGSVASRLRRVAAAAAAGDRAACLDAARYADEVLVLTGGNGP